MAVEAQSCDMMFDVDPMVDEDDDSSQVATTIIQDDDG